MINLTRYLNAVCRTVLRRMRVFFNQAFRHFRIHSIRFEISIIYTVILGIILLVFSGVFYGILSRTLYAEFDGDLRAKAEEIAQNIVTYLNVKGEEPQALKFAAEKTIASDGKTLRRWWYIGFERGWFERLDKQDLSGDYINFAGPDGSSIVHSKNMTPEALAIFAQTGTAGAKESSFRYVVIDARKTRIVNYPFSLGSNGRYLLQVGSSPKPIILLLQDWMMSIFLSIPVILLLTSFIGYMLASRILRPIEKITRTARNITYQDLSMRVQSQDFYKETNSLSHAFNDMISRLEKSFKHIEEFSAHVAHELKTPLTIIRGETELALYADRSIEEYKKALKVNLEETEKILTTVEDLLFLAKMDYQPEAFHFGPVNFNEFLNEICQQAKILCLNKKIKVDYACPEDILFFVKADRVHLRRLFFNLIDNAIKFTPQGGHISIEAKAERMELRLTITDNGPGIPQEHLEKIFNRFYRIDGQRVGTGLGLNIAMTIAKIHRGDILVSSQLGSGTSFTVTLPLISKQAVLPAGV